MSDAGPSQVARAPVGGSAVHEMFSMSGEATSVGATL